MYAVYNCSPAPSPPTRLRRQGWPPPWSPRQCSSPSSASEERATPCSPGAVRNQRHGSDTSKYFMLYACDGFIMMKLKCVFDMWSFAHKIHVSFNEMTRLRVKVENALSIEYYTCWCMIFHKIVKSFFRRNFIKILVNIWFANKIGRASCRERVYVLV